MLMDIVDFKRKLMRKQTHRIPSDSSVSSGNSIACNIIPQDVICAVSLPQKYTTIVNFNVNFTHLRAKNKGRGTQLSN